MPPQGEPFRPSKTDIETALPNIQVVNELGVGGQKVVFAAKSSYGETALKLIRPAPAPALDRARREIETLQRLKDPHFPVVFESGSVTIGGYNEVFYVLEELLHGESLRQRLNKEGALSLPLAVKITEELLSALMVVEAIPAVHRDIKPENIMIEAERVLLLDFGIMRHLALDSLTHDFALFGPCTPGYGAPEQIRNEKRSVSHRTDLFAVGIVLYEMLTGINPFGDPDPKRALEKTLRLDPEPLSSLGFPLGVSVLVGRCLEKSPHRRIPSARAALQELRRIH